MWKVGVQGRKTKCGVFGWDAPHNFRHLNTWCILVASWAGLGVYHRAQVLRLQKLQAIPGVLSTSCLLFRMWALRFSYCSGVSLSFLLLLQTGSTHPWQWDTRKHLVLLTVLLGHFMLFNAFLILNLYSPNLKKNAYKIWKRKNQI